MRTKKVFNNPFSSPQTEEQYIFIHDALLGDASIPAPGRRRSLCMLQAQAGALENPQPHCHSACCSTSTE